ncbi:hypothetical protein [Paracandidimonas lactea]|uniref:hypothetical protein n=1 Tax=Paracandidimonas lactea TaxID=2895524 RepID=UPI001F3927B0|nr:hypothetical protein [Paracandidimonas lactea]
MDATPLPARDAGANDHTRKMAGLLAQARNITRAALGRAPAVVVAEVFRQLCVELDYVALAELDDSVRQVH